ncbi:SsgA family sporulation/cell division regulator [Streptomyces sp. NPDC052236]|uniref:SsgA family sporulation/cell division regulator n=1 Tax=Streptomyces sp. NPDC052236 TaxID=3365686 RepID=UPI0037D988EB
MNTMVERELELTFVLSSDRRVPVPARLIYRTDDPYAVHITFHTASDHPVHWTFARELLAEGLFRPSGTGDVRIWPATPDDRGALLLALSSPQGEALLEASAAVVSGWLERTLRLVPPGAESERLGMDNGLAELFASSEGESQSG